MQPLHTARPTPAKPEYDTDPMLPAAYQGIILSGEQFVSFKQVEAPLMPEDCNSCDKTIRSLEKPGYIARLIAYLSFTMLAAAAGSLFGEAWARLWFSFGLFGLVSSTGLYILSKSRARAAYIRKKTELLQKAEKHLKKMVVVEESFDEISEAVRRIQCDAADSENQSDAAKIGPRLPLNKPVTITPLGWSEKISDESFPARLRNISSYGFGLAHDCALQRGYVMLEFDLRNRESVRFIADLLWCEQQQDGQFHSGGKLLEVVSPIAAGAAR